MLASVRKQIEQEGLLSAGDTVVVGVSGGVDSSALLHILWTLNQHYHYGWKLHAVHLNHRFRGEEARRDALYAQALCESLGVTFHLFERDVSLYMKQERLGAQEASREIRYELFREVAEQTGATKVAVAHHADDQVETILFRLLRGTGLHGLTGIPPRRWLVPDTIEVVRPLLPVFRSDLERYCEQAGLAPREDSSNRSRKYKRNRLRLDILPLMAEINPRYREHILELAETVKMDEAYLMEMTKTQEKQVLIERSLNKVVISRKKFQNCDLALQRRLITLILSYLSSGIEWSSQHVKAVLNVIESDIPSAALDLPKQLSVKRRYDQVHFLLDRPSEDAGSFCYELKIPGTVDVAESGVAVHASLRKTAPDWSRLSQYEAVFDADRMPGELIVRSRRPGDRIVLFGSQATKKLKELLIDAKVPKAYRDRLPVVAAGDEIVWVPGLRRSATAVVNENTTGFLHLKVEYGEDWQEVFP